MEVASIIITLVVFLYILRATAIKKNKQSKNREISTDEREVLETNVAFYQKLPEEKKRVFEQKVLSFLEGVIIEGIGTDVTLSDRMLIASSAVIPIFGFPDWKYKNLRNILVYPENFNKSYQFEGHADRNIMGMVGDGLMNGKMLLSQSALRAGFSMSNDGNNTAIHEFVHLLDKSDGATDGIPEYLLNHSYTIPWLKIIHQEMLKIEKNKSDINPYALTNEAEFFAVVSEYFFEKPDQLKKRHPELYEKLTLIFDQDLAVN